MQQKGQITIGNIVFGFALLSGSVLIWVVGDDLSQAFGIPAKVKDARALMEFVYLCASFLLRALHFRKSI